MEYIVTSYISKLIDLLFYIEVEKRLTFNKNLGLFGLIPAWSSCFGPISEVSCFDPIGAAGIFSVYLRGRLWAPVPMQNTLILSQFDKKKLENCVCKTQVMPPCPKPVLTPCPILTHDPQHIQSIVKTIV